MVEIYDIMNITCQNLYHMPYQPSTYITPRAGSPRGDIGFSGWYGMWYRFWHVIFSIYCMGVSIISNVRAIPLFIPFSANQHFQIIYKNYNIQLMTFDEVNTIQLLTFNFSLLMIDWPRPTVNQSLTRSIYYSHE
jgi:hypothetical protein